MDPQPAVRDPAVAGTFYPSRPHDVEHALRRLFAGVELSERHAVGVVCPHAGWMYSGALAARTLSSVHVPPRVIVMCPNHTGRGVPISVSKAPAWRTPTADVPIDAQLADAILEELRVAGVRGAGADERAHAREHAIEVQLPLLHERQPGLQLTAIVLAHLEPEECARLGRAIAAAVARLGLCWGEDVMIVASSDMNHFDDEATTRQKDALALAALATGDGARLLSVVDGAGISMCGARPAAALLACAHAVGAPAPELVGYTTSGAVSGDLERVVGYAGAVVPCKHDRP
jgi:AmmeMemoRadiSam system protein B